jgi:PmbA protein
MIDCNKCLAAAKDNGIAEYELYISRSASPVQFETFRGELSSFTSSDVTTISARGIVDGKMGYAFSEVLDDSTAEYLAKQVKANAGIVDSDEKPFIFKGSKEYKKVDTFNPELEKVSVDTKIALMKDIEAKIRAYDPRIAEVETYYGETVAEVTILNTYGLELNDRNNYFALYASVTAKSGEETKSGFKVEMGNDFSAIDVDKIVKEAAEETLSQFGGEPCVSREYPCVLDKSCTANLLLMFLESAKAESVQKHSSYFEGKLNTAVASGIVNIVEDPAKANIMCRTFDDEGVATYQKDIVRDGVLKTFAYNLTTADKDGVETTGNGYKAGATGKVVTQFVNVDLEAGKLSQEELFRKAGEGIFITDLAGLHSGMNPTSGNFSLQASGYLIENGKKGKPVTLITVAGNLFDMFTKVTEIGNDSKLSRFGITCPSILLSAIAVSGK